MMNIKIVVDKMPLVAHCYDMTELTQDEIELLAKDAILRRKAAERNAKWRARHPDKVDGARIKQKLFRAKARELRERIKNEQP